MKILLYIVSLSLLYFFWTIGSFSEPKSWEITSGFTDIPINSRPAFYTPPNNSYPEIYWLGHGGHFIKWKGLNILLDPMLSDHSVILPRLALAPVKAEDLPEIDYVILSHMHYDHYDKETLEKIKTLKNLVLPKNSEIFITEGIIRKSKLIPLRENEVYTDNELQIISLKTLHNGSRNHPFSSDYRASAYLIKIGETSVYFSGDTGYGPQFKDVKERYSPNISIIPIGAYEPYFLLHKYHLNPEDAVWAGLDLGSGIVIPSHFGTFRMSLESPQTALPLFVQNANRNGLNIALAKMYE